MFKKGGGSSIHFITWNVKDMNGPNKRACIFAHLKKLKMNIAFLQETHLQIADQIADQVRFRKPWFGQIFHSHFNSKTRGATIIIQKKVQFNASKCVSDPQGCFVIVTAYLFLIPVVLVCVYGPKLGRC